MEYSLKEDLIDGFLDTLASRNFLPKFLQSRALLYCVILLLALKIFTIVVSINFPQNIFFADITKISLFNLVNQTRLDAGMAILSKSEKLDKAAELKAEDMVQNGYFSHQSPQGVSPWHWFKLVGYNYKYAGENLAVGFFNSEDVYNAWLSSPSHKENLLNPNYKDVGTAVLGGFGENKAIVVVQIFGSEKIEMVPAEPSGKVEESPSVDNPIERSQAQTELGKEASEKVLSQSVKALPYFSEKEINDKNTFYLKLLNFIVYDYEILLRWITYGFLAITATILFLWLISNFDMSQKSLILRSFTLIFLLVLAAIIDKRILALILNPQILI